MDLNVKFTGDNLNSDTSWVSMIFPIVATIVMGILLFIMFRQMAGSNGKAMNFGKNKAKLQSNVKVRFSDVAGAEEEKEELKEIVEFLNFISSSVAFSPLCASSRLASISVFMLPITFFKPSNWSPSSKKTALPAPNPEEISYNDLPSNILSGKIAKLEYVGSNNIRILYSDSKINSKNFPKTQIYHSTNYQKTFLRPKYFILNFILSQFGIIYHTFDIIFTNF